MASSVIEIAGTQLEIQVLSVTDTGDTEIVFSNPINGFLLRSRGGNALQFRATSGATDYISIPAGETFNLSIANKTPGYVRAADAATDTVEAIGVY